MQEYDFFIFTSKRDKSAYGTLGSTFSLFSMQLLRNVDLLTSKWRPFLIFRVSSSDRCPCALAALYAIMQSIRVCRESDPEPEMERENRKLNGNATHNVNLKGLPFHGYFTRKILAIKKAKNAAYSYGGKNECRIFISWQTRKKGHFRMTKGRSKVGEPSNSSRHFTRVPNRESGHFRKFRPHRE